MLTATFFCALALAPQAGDKAGEAQPEVWREYDVPAAPPLSPEEALAAFTVAEGFRVELVAAEPLVVDPVFVQFDGEGRLWVVEMRGYMPDVDGTGETEPVGCIAVLEDEDGDGRMDRRTEFLTGLVLPRALCVVDGGALVLEPPGLYFAADHDGDLVCDERTLLRAGFEAGVANPEHAPNGLMYGLDNRLYMANDPRSYAWDGETLTAGLGLAAGQWGVAHDDWGRTYSNTNGWPLFADLVPARYLRRNEAFGKAAGGFSKVCQDGECWPGRINPGVNRAYRKGTLREDGTLRTWTGACGPHIYRGTRFPEPFRGGAFVPEPCGNFVHFCAVEEKDGDLRSVNPYADARGEFLVSTDERFRPVNVASGPDGGIYVVDLYRGILQHRVFLTSQLRKQILERGLDEPVGLGRIWRVVPDDEAEVDGVDPTAPAWAPGRPRLSGMGGRELASLLTHPDGWWRDAAQQEVLRRGRADAEMVAQVVQLAATADGAKPMVHLLWTLDGLGLETGWFAARAIHFDEPHVVAHALRVSEDETDDPLVWAAWLAAAERPERVVRRQLALSLGESGHPDALSLLADLLLADASDRILREGAVSSAGGREQELARLLLERGAPGDRKDLETALDLLSKCAAKRAEDGGAGRRDLAALPERHRKSVERGERTFRMLCAACHQHDGSGLEDLAPPLDGSDWLEKPDGALVRVVLEGLTGPIEVNGKPWDLVMPPLSTLSDQEVADVLNHVRFRFDDRKELPPPVTPEAVAAERPQEARGQ